MKKVVILLVVFLVPIICWFLGAFIAGVLNPFLWPDHGRLALVMFVIIATAITELFIWMNF